MALFELGEILGKIALVAREQEITLGEMRQSGPRWLLVYCGDYKCAHSVTSGCLTWSRSSPVCGHRGAHGRPLFEQARMGTGS